MTVTDRELFEGIRRRAGLASAGAAEEAAALVLSSLVARLSWRGQHMLAWALPPKARRLALGPANTGFAYAPYSAFLRDLDDELALGRSRVDEIARAVAAELAGLLTQDQLRELRAELHGTFNALFG